MMTKPHKPILCLDFDGVIHSYTSGWKGARNIPDPPMPGSLAFMLDMLNAGWRVVIHSSRGQHFGGIRAMRKWLYKHAMAEHCWYEYGFGLGLEDVEFSRTKPSAIMTIDDRAVQFTGKFPSVADVKAFKPWKLPA